MPRRPRFMAPGSWRPRSARTIGSPASARHVPGQGSTAEARLSRSQPHDLRRSRWRRRSGAGRAAAHAPSAGRDRTLVLPQQLQLLGAAILDPDQALIRIFDRANELIELDLDRGRVAGAGHEDDAR
jgi:hypothetical protein